MSCGCTFLPFYFSLLSSALRNKPWLNFHFVKSLFCEIPLTAFHHELQVEVTCVEIEKLSERFPTSLSVSSPLSHFCSPGRVTQYNEAWQIQNLQDRTTGGTPREELVLQF
jgi:hypothetical protein